MLTETVINYGNQMHIDEMLLAVTVESGGQV